MAPPERAEGPFEEEMAGAPLEAEDALTQRQPTPPWRAALRGSKPKARSYVVELLADNKASGASFSSLPVKFAFRQRTAFNMGI